MIPEPRAHLGGFFGVLRKRLKYETSKQKKNGPRNRNGAMRLWLTMGLAIPTMLSEPAAASRMEVLGYSIEANITPSLAKLQARLKLSDAQLQKMLVAMPAVLFEKNLGPKLDWLQHELQLSTADLRARVLAAPRILGRQVAWPVAIVDPRAGLHEPRCVPDGRERRQCETVALLHATLRSLVPYSAGEEHIPRARREQ